MIKKNVDSHKDPRHIARMLAVQYLFTKLKQTQTNVDTAFYEPQALLAELEEKTYNKKLYELIVEGVTENIEEIDKIIQSHAPAWPLDQINPVDLSILRVATWEGLFYKENPLKVVINEAIELSKELSSEKSSKFINGVLGKLAE